MTKSTARAKSPILLVHESHANTKRSLKQPSIIHQQKNSTRNIMLGDGYSEGLYVDTNLDKEENYLHRDFAPEPHRQSVKTEADDLQSTHNQYRLKNATDELLPQLLEPITTSQTSSLEKLTGKFNTK